MLLWPSSSSVNSSPLTLRLPNLFWPGDRTRDLWSQIPSFLLSLKYLSQTKYYAVAYTHSEKQTFEVCRDCSTLNCATLNHSSVLIFLVPLCLGAVVPFLLTVTDFTSGCSFQTFCRMTLAGPHPPCDSIIKGFKQLLPSETRTKSTFICCQSECGL